MSWFLEFSVAKVSQISEDKKKEIRLDFIYNNKEAGEFNYQKCGSRKNKKNRLNKEAYLCTSFDLNQ